MASKRKPTATPTSVAAAAEEQPAVYRLTAWTGPSSIFVGDFCTAAEAIAHANEVRLNGLTFGNPNGEWHCYPPHVITRLHIKPVA